ncbi:MAG TPA: hypothetical protein VGS19_35290 [Streptosporangiaceae bacterium]|nr:hypothetical protein [Streptosporangiaceae bacterium]
MREYCKAYQLAELRRFPGWVESTAPGAPALSDDTVVYVWDDLTVVTNPVAADQGVLFDAVDEEWVRFCHAELSFAIPEGLHD